MFFKVLLVLSVFILVHGFECPNYCTCIESFVAHTNDKILQATCKQIDGLKRLNGELSNVNEIDLSAINLSELSTNFSSFKVLSAVDLSHNGLSKIPKLNNRITNLTLSHNQLTSTCIANLPLHVQYLDLAYNKITSVPKDMMRLNRLRKLKLAGNLLDCNCDSIRVRNWLVKNFITIDGVVTCTTPKKFRDRSWLEIDEFDVCEFRKIKNIEHFIESDELMLADEPLSLNFDNEGSGNEELTTMTTTTSDSQLLQAESTDIILKPYAMQPRSSAIPYFKMAKEVIDLLPKKKSEDGTSEVYATSGVAGIVMIALTVFAVYKKNQKDAADIETGENGEELKTIGDLELAKANALIMSIDSRMKADNSTNLEEVVKNTEDVQDLQAPHA